MPENISKDDYYGSTLEEQDKLRILEHYGPTEIHCIGGRYIAKGYVCPHCKSDSPSTECKDPLSPENKPTMEPQHEILMSLYYEPGSLFNMGLQHLKDDNLDNPEYRFDDIHFKQADIVNSVLTYMQGVHEHNTVLTMEQFKEAIIDLITQS